MASLGSIYPDDPEGREASAWGAAGLVAAHLVACARALPAVWFAAYPSSMFKVLGRTFQVALGLAVLVVLVGAAGWIIYTSVTQAPAVVAAVVTGFAALVGVFLQRQVEQQREDERIRRQRMTPIYERLVTTFYKSAGSAGEISESETTEFFEDLAQRLLLWGATPVLQAFNAWKAIAVEHADSDADPTKSLLAFEQLLYAMRADLGQSNEGLGQGDLLRVMINDIDEYLPTAPGQTPSLLGA